MPDSAFLEWIEIEGFRGFARCQRLDLNASVVIVTGSNGTGKTSFFDALQWLLLGRLDRLQRWRMRRNVEHVVNQYLVVEGMAATVRASLRVNGQSVEIRRTGRYDGSHFEWRGEGKVLYNVQGEEALAHALMPAGQVSLERSLLSSGLLQQDVIRDVLEDKPADRYNHLAAILGLNAIADFPVAAKARADRIAKEAERARRMSTDLETEMRKMRGDLVTLREQAKQAPNAAAVRAQIGQKIAAHAEVVQLRSELPLTSEDAERLHTAAGLGAGALDRLLAEIEAIPVVTAPPPDLEALRLALKTAQDATAKAREIAEAVEKRYEDERQASSRLSRLAAEAIPLLEANCPVCQQQIDAEHVRAHLQQQMDKGSRELSELRQKLDAALTDFKKRQAEETQASKVLAEAEQISKALVQRKAWHSKVIDLLPELDQQFNLQQKAPLVEGNADAMRVAQAALAAIADSAKELVTAFGWVRESTAASAVQAQLEKLKDQMFKAHQRAADMSAKEESARALQRAAVRAAAAVTDKRFSILHPVIKDIYARLDPHPTFTDLNFAVDVYRERGIANPLVTDSGQGISANPLVIFSSAQANLVALSAFLALGWAGEDSMPFLLLDDPLQSLDDVNTLGFADLCRHMRTHRQLIVSTHDPRLGALLARKLAPRRAGERTRYLRFVAWSRKGPVIESAELAPQPDQGSSQAPVPAAKSTPQPDPVNPSAPAVSQTVA